MLFLGHIRMENASASVANTFHSYPSNSCMIVGSMTGGMWYVTPPVTKKKIQMDTNWLPCKAISDFCSDAGTQQHLRSAGKPSSARVIAQVENR